MKSPKSAMREKNVYGLTMHQMVYLALFLAVVAVILGSFGTKAYYDVVDNPHENQEMNNLRINEHLDAKYTAFITGIFSGVSDLTVTPITPSVATTVALPADTVVVSSWTSIAGTAVFTLPQARRGALIVWRQIVNASGANAVGVLAFTRLAGDVFNVNNTVTALPVGVATLVSQAVTPTAANTIFRYTNHATAGAWGEIGSTITFYCAADGVWSVRVPQSIAADAGTGGVFAFA